MATKRNSPWPTLIGWLVWGVAGAFAGSTVTLDGVARDCQKQTFFHVSDKRFECMEWKENVIYWDPTPTLPPH